MSLTVVVPIFGPPAAGKTTLTMRLGEQPGRTVFRLREHVPVDVLATTATSAERLGWIDDITVATALYGYFDAVRQKPTVEAVLLDNFPGSSSQVGLLVSMLHTLAPAARVQAVELVADPSVLRRRARNRRVCHQCEHDPIRDPRVPATPSSTDRQRCATCGGILHPRRGDAPSLFKARIHRYRQTATAIREAFRASGVLVAQLDGAQPLGQITDTVASLIQTNERTGDDDDPPADTAHAS
jgi:adenylate kinase family enzyme